MQKIHIKHCECGSYKKPVVVSTWKDGKGNVFVDEACCSDCFKVVITDGSTTIKDFLKLK